MDLDSSDCMQTIVRENLTKENKSIDMKDFNIKELDTLTAN